MTNIDPRLATNIQHLSKAGQSVWCDNLSKEILDNGELAAYISAGVTGLTSNPAIFKKAIADSSFYDKDVLPFKTQGLTAEKTTEALMIRDVARAADLFLPVFENTKGNDGHVSIEVSPNLATDTSATIASAVEIWNQLNRPNIMIKVPATPAGIPAIEELLWRGINVNVTLIFSVAVYEQVADAFISAISRRVAEGKPVKDIASVASFFVSRVDSIVEKELNARKDLPEVKSLLGGIGIANSRLAYELFEKKFFTDEYKKLRKAGAQYQRPLWASTGVKNPAYSPVLYVDTLAAPHTVNTMPPQTIAALCEGVSVVSDVRAYKESHEILKRLASLGVDFDKLLITLQHEGVKLFEDAYRDLLAAVEKKMGSN